MDPALYDLMWSVYREVRGTRPISIVSSYRSPKTNAMLRKASSGVAENSQHINGKAIDFFIPGVDLAVLRAAAMRHQVGGVGYYPTSGSPFVHLDTGNVRAWPRMTRAQLQRVFPDGRTMHLPVDGKPLSNEGYAYAQAQWKKCHSVPCGGPVTPTSAEVVYAAVSPDVAPIPAMPPRVRQGARIELASLGDAPTQRSVATLDISANSSAATDETAPFPVPRPARLTLAAASPQLPAGGTNALAALNSFATSAPADDARPELVTAYLGPDADAQNTLRTLIEDEATGSVGPVGGTGGLVLKGMFDDTFNALERSAAPKEMTAALANLVALRQPNPSISLREDIDLVAPELDHVNQTLVMPVLMTAPHFAALSETEGHLGKDTELGPLTGRLGFAPEAAYTLAYDRFQPTASLFVAAH